MRDLLPLERDLAALVDERTRGNPLFVLRLLGDWVSGGRLEQGPDGLRLRDGGPADLPDDLHQLWNDLVERALAGQPPEVGVALELAAALGQDVSMDEWADVCARSGVGKGAGPPHDFPGCVDTDGPAPAWIEEIVDHLVVRHLARRPVERAERRFAFVHGMLRECLVRRAAAAGRIERHQRRCADMLWGRPGHGMEERRGQHLLAAGDGRAALGPLFDAAAERHLSGDFGLAAGLLARASEAISLADLPPDDERRGELAVRRARLAEYRGRIAQAERWAIEARQLAEARTWPRVLGGVLHELGRIRRVQGRLAEALGLLERAIATTALTGDHYREGHSELDRGRVLCNLGRIGEAGGAIDTARRIFDRHGFKVPSIWSRIAQAELALTTGDTGAALALAAKAEDEYTALDHLHGRAYSSAALALILRHRGALPEAEERCRYAIEQFDLLDHAEAPVQRLNLAQILWEKGAAGPALPILEEQVSVFSADGRAIYEVRGRAMLAAAAAASREWRRRDVEFGRVRAILRVSALIDPDVTRALDLARRAAGSAGSHRRALAALDAIQDEVAARPSDPDRLREAP
ncbi:MAG: hypothetical protein HY897_14175 [Deltaproteobacteria bacterium]|nr:hypothetical protein [Deltaproteobacteria bacterium]